MPGQTLVEERVVGIQQVEHAAILADDAVEEQRGLALEGLTQIVVEVKEQFRAGPEPGHIADVKPLAGEVAHQRLRARVGEHPPHLLVEHDRIPERLLLRDVQQLVIRDAAPQEERQTRRQLEVGDAIRRIRRDGLRLTLEAEQKLRADEDAANRQFEARLKACLSRAIAVPGQRDLKIVVGNGPSIGAPRERRDDLPGAGGLVGGRRGLADEQPAAAGRIVDRRRGGRVRAGDRHAGNARLAVAGPIGISTQSTGRTGLRGTPRSSGRSTPEPDESRPSPARGTEAPPGFFRVRSVRRCAFANSGPPTIDVQTLALIEAHIQLMRFRGDPTHAAAGAVLVQP